MIVFEVLLRGLDSASLLPVTEVISSYSASKEAGRCSLSPPLDSRLRKVVKPCSWNLLQSRAQDTIEVLPRTFSSYGVPIRRLFFQLRKRFGYPFQNFLIGILFQILFQIRPFRAEINRRIAPEFKIQRSHLLTNVGNSGSKEPRVSIPTSKNCTFGC